MIDWQDIPLHIRCTNRHLIDPTYPADDPAKWWSQQEERANRDAYDQNGAGHLRRGLNPVAQYMLEVIQTGQTTSLGEIRKQFPAITGEQFNAALYALSSRYPVYTTQAKKHDIRHVALLDRSKL